MSSAGPRGPRPVVVVGDVGLDVLVRPDRPVARGDDTPSRTRLVPGGAGGNTAAWLAASGIPVALVSRVGDDDAARAARRPLEAGGVVCRFVTDPDLSTCIVVVVVEPDGRTMLPDRGANAALCPADLDLGGAARAAAEAGGLDPDARPHLHLSGFVLLDARSRPAGLAALDEARRSGWTTSVDPQAASHLDTVGAATFLAWVSGVDLLLPNAPEAAALGGDRVMLEAAREVAVSAGPQGARWLSPTHTWEVAAPAVSGGDATGCGDAFDAGVLAAWTAGAGPQECLARGVRLGSAAAGREGARP
ncbi:MAG: PfkB family carbohydrate kinase [Lapillicoccus sp.]